MSTRCGRLVSLLLELKWADMGDELYEVRNSLIIGNFHQTIAEGSNAKTVLKRHEEVQNFNIQRDALVAKAQIGLGQWDAVLADLSTATHPTLVAVRKWAELQKTLASGGDGSALAAQLADGASDVVAAKGEAAVTAAAALIAVKDYAGALRLCNQWLACADLPARNAIEFRAISADGYLRLNRPDLAEKEVAQMKANDDESTLTLLTAGVVALRQGVTKPEKYAEAAQFFTEITGRCGQSVLALNLLALANLGRGKPQDAERNLLDALAKKSGDPETVANLVVVASQLSKPAEMTLRNINQAKAITPQSQWAKTYNQMEERLRDAIAAAQ